MRYTISVAFVIGTEPDALEHVNSDPLHVAIVEHIDALAHVLRAEYPDRDLSIMLADMIVSAPEVELCPRPI